MVTFALATWATYLIGGGATVAVVALVYVIWRFAQKSTVKRIMQVSGVVLDGVSSMIEDNKSKTDVHDILKIVGHLSTTAASAIENPEMKDFGDVKDSIVSFVKDSLKELDNDKLSSLPDNVIEKSAEAAFVTAKSVNTLTGEAKK